MDNKSLTEKDYRERVNNVLVFINKNLGEKLDLNILASVSNFSPFHFHRIVRAFINEPLGTYIIRLRVEMAAGLIENTDLSITDICFKVGYDSLSSFNKAFKKRFDISPSEYRENKNAKLNYMKENDMEAQINLLNFKLKPKVKDYKNKKAVYIQSFGDYSGPATGESWNKIFEFVKKNRLFHWKTECFGISLDNPDITETDKCRYMACVTVSKEVKPDGEVGVTNIEGGRFAVFRYRGPYSNLNLVYAAIIRRWLPQSGYDLREQPLMEKYLNNPAKTKPERLLTEIYVPVQ
ncbi:MAG: hypothetical protein A2W91_00885 [Bacteroidetes bacterium GWF2_38_335]|nr:MAG: hypothetical protein A2W91_00885 [Bacteroidetes bacterium GWF2_38_335]OFY80310.1 MAG: hypothetical protein A2281_17395 [Bacteroidetes bacterium RIFOXYA12_FULL_38_20]HBS88890.1 AraC family transcriptional regulator [Bacteroidales bacterium]